MYLIWQKRLSAINAKKNLTQPNVICLQYISEVCLSTFHCMFTAVWTQMTALLIEGCIYLLFLLLNKRSFVQPNFTVFSVHCILIRNNKMAGHVDNFTIFIFLFCISNIITLFSLYMHVLNKKDNIFILWRVMQTALIVVFMASLFFSTEPGQSAGVRWQIHRAELRPLWLYCRDPACLCHHFPDPEELQIQTKTGSALIRTNRRRKWTISRLSGV